MINSVALLIIGAYLVTVSIKGRHVELFNLLLEEKGFIWWLLALTVLWGVMVAIVPRRYHSMIVIILIAMIALGTRSGAVFTKGIEQLVNFMSNEVTNG